jgi:hypothetical protein
MPLDNAAACAVDTLPRAHLVLSVAQALHDGLPLEAVAERLWREDPSEIAGIFDRVATASLDHAAERPYGRLEELRREAIAEARRAAPKPQRSCGLTLDAIAERTSMARATLVALLEHHGILELAPCGGTQRRRLLSDVAVRNGLGHNVQPGAKRVAALEGFGKAAPFPVLYEERLTEVLWCLDAEGIAKEAERHARRADRLPWLLAHHGYLPGDELARLSGYSVRAVRMAQAGPELHSQVI